MQRSAVSAVATEPFTTTKSAACFEEAKTLMPGGVSSPVRAFKSVGGDPVVFDRVKGAYAWDVDNNKYIDYVGSWGPAIIGHADDEVLDALKKVIEKGTSFGAPSALENVLAKMVIDAVPSVEMVRFTNSGTEACMGVLRLMRAYTKREKLIKFEGCYHGHADSFLVQAGSGVATLGLPDSPGVPQGATKSTLCAKYNDLASVEAIFEANKGEIAGVILEPVVGNSGFIAPDVEFLTGLRELTKKHGALLCFDEVREPCRACVHRALAARCAEAGGRCARHCTMSVGLGSSFGSGSSPLPSAPPDTQASAHTRATWLPHSAPFAQVMTGFRISYGCAQKYYGITPDLTTMGKVIGGGLPVGAYGGRRDIMEMVAPAGPMYQAGTLSGNPLAMTAGIKTLERLQKPGACPQPAARVRARPLRKRLRALHPKAGVCPRPSGHACALAALRCSQRGDGTLGCTQRIPLFEFAREPSNLSCKIAWRSHARTRTRALRRAAARAHPPRLPRPSVRTRA